MWPTSDYKCLAEKKLGHPGHQLVATSATGATRLVATVIPAMETASACRHGNEKTCSPW